MDDERSLSSINRLLSSCKTKKDIDRVLDASRKGAKLLASAATVAAMEDRSATIVADARARATTAGSAPLLVMGSTDGQRLSRRGRPGPLDKQQPAAAAAAAAASNGPPQQEQGNWLARKARRMGSWFSNASSKTPATAETLDTAEATDSVEAVEPSTRDPGLDIESSSSDDSVDGSNAGSAGMTVAGEGSGGEGVERPFAFHPLFFGGVSFGAGSAQTHEGVMLRGSGQLPGHGNAPAGSHLPDEGGVFLKNYFLERQRTVRTLKRVWRVADVRTWTGCTGLFSSYVRTGVLYIYYYYIGEYQSYPIICQA